MPIMRKLIYSLIIVLLSCSCQKSHISVHALKDRFEQGDKIIINGWMILNGSDLFDSLTVYTKTVWVKYVKKDSAIVRYGYIGEKNKIIELTVRDFNPVLYDNCIDTKVIKYLHPNNPVLYFVDGAPCETYKIALGFVINKRIAEVRTLNPQSATAIWGTRLGKNGAIIINSEEELRRTRKEKQ